MPIETEPERLQIETGRTWRDLPSEPPATAPVRREQAPPPPPRDETRSWPWARIGIGALALAVGISVGVWAPWADEGTSDTEPLATEGLPDTIVPETPPELIPGPNPSEDGFDAVPDDFEIPEEFFDQLPDGFLEGLPEGLFEGIPGPSPEDAGLIDLADLPNGYQARSNVYSQSGDRASQRIRLLGPGGPIDVQAIRGPEVALPDSGQPFDVDGLEGRLVTSGDSTTISWLAQPDLLVTVEAAADVDRDVLADVVAAVEVRP